MAEQLKSKRVEFQPGKQKEFIEKSKMDLGLNWQEFASFAKTSVRNLNDWKNEKISMSLIAVENICKKRKCKIPENVILKDQYWYTKKAGLIGGRATIEKYGIIGGDQKNRKAKWQEWWEKEGKKNPNNILQPLPFRKPKFSKELAEFVGIVLGDGGISKRQITITLHRITDKEYSKFVRKMIEKLFNIKAGEYNNKKSLADGIVISRTDLVKYLIENIGLKKGNKVKQQVDIPQWIKKDMNFKIACIRGLVDTDGCLVIHKYKSKGKDYSYKKLSFTNRSFPLLNSARKILNELNIKNRITKNNLEIRVEAKKDVEKYFNTIGSHNPKHVLRYKN
ncbi:MAG: LAGLIDADG family homing endonuclease [Candidatus Moranbacteria bacterium]|nr:LAGLIDADG family homing endonuclease [Candidatus Moranbacteria bacterium]